jgi:hypothetical protein
MKRELQGFVWHTEKVTDLGNSPMAGLAALSRRVDIETDGLEKKFSSKAERELMHNVHVYGNDDNLLVEFHVDFLTVEDRLKKYAYYWGGGCICVSKLYMANDFSNSISLKHFIL